MESSLICGGLIFGMTATTFKERYRNHKSSINNKRHANDAELSKHVWKLKDSGKQVNIKWSILKHATPRKAGDLRCNLCLTEKHLIILADQRKILNKRSYVQRKILNKRILEIPTSE